jgi:hypothetical protein
MTLLYYCALARLFASISDALAHARAMIPDRYAKPPACLNFSRPFVVLAPTTHDADIDVE